MIERTNKYKILAEDATEVVWLALDKKIAKGELGMRDELLNEVSAYIGNLYATILIYRKHEGHDEDTLLLLIDDAVDVFYDTDSSLDELSARFKS